MLLLNQFKAQVLAQNISGFDIATTTIYYAVQHRLIDAGCLVDLVAAVFAGLNCFG